MSRSLPCLLQGFALLAVLHVAGCRPLDSGDSSLMSAEGNTWLENDENGNQLGHKWAPFLTHPAAFTDLRKQQEWRNTLSALHRQHAQKFSQPEDRKLIPGSTPWVLPLHDFNTTEVTRLLPKNIAWLIDQWRQHGDNFNQTVRFDINRILTFADMVSISYCTPYRISTWNCTRCNHMKGFEPETVVFDQGWDLQAYVGYSPELNAKLVSFRGTDSHSIFNWVENMRYWRTDFGVPYPGANGSLVHTGFFKSYNNSALRPNITAAIAHLQELHPDSSTYVLGHSLGGALAQICALDIAVNMGEQQVGVITFGSPRVGNAAFDAFFMQHVQESWRLTHNRDIVPSVPLQLMGFHHVPREVWEVSFDGHTVLGLCDETGEDPRCHNSVCYFGLCTSLSDHLVYLGVPFYREGC